MRTRSSRFFIVLLHLLGVSNHHLPSWYYELLTSTSSSDRSAFYSSGIRGVHPHSIVLERLDLREVGGLDGVEWLTSPDSQQQQQQQQQHQKERRSQEATSSTSQTIKEPFWLQDTQDGKCLGPSGGFSECGDATLWFILRRGTQRKSLRMGPFGVEEILERANPEEPYRYALQIVDNDSYENQQGYSSSSLETTRSRASFFPLPFPWRQRRQQQQQHDCLVPSSRRQQKTLRQEENGVEFPLSSLELGSCNRHKTAWSWRVDPEGFLYLPVDASQSNHRECVRRTKSSSAVLSSCQQDKNSSTGVDHLHQHQRLVQFSLVRYHATTTPSLTSSTTSPASRQKKGLLRPVASDATTTKTTRDVQSNMQKEGGASGETDNSKTGKRLPSTVDIAHSHASGRVMHSPLLEMNLAGRPLLSRIPSRESRRESESSPFAALKDSNPILFLGSARENQGRNGVQKKSPMNNQKATSQSASHNSNNNNLPPPTPGKLRKIETNPYIAQSKDEIWVDPQTGLEYHTDLCRYLGHDRKEYGRHTLVGVGQFLKTMLKIKVYGIAFYVSKRDVLADPSFQQYAGLSAEELRNRPDFYEKLRTMPPPDADPSEGGFFDRTLFLKTNMQLSTETMRSSLDSDWKMLSEDDKALLIDTSMKPRPADEQMLAEIVRPNNPSHCSCAQTAPEEYQADPSCCARGIELVFTWRKNGDIEVRLNGRLMDSFPRPDIGGGIFFEYLRQDDPFSTDFLERVVDGFPFLLAPLAQIQGITSSVLQQPSPPKTPDSHGQKMLKALSGAADAFSSNAVGLASAVQHGASEAASNAMHVAQNAGDAMRNFGEEAERKREALWKNMVTMSQQNPSEILAQLVAKAEGEHDEEEIAGAEPESPQASVNRDVPHGRIFRPTTSKWFGETLEAPDEIAPMVHPTMNKTVLSLVHLYLLLILIVSFPPTNNNRTRFVVRRSCKMISVSSSEASFVKPDSVPYFKEQDTTSFPTFQNGRGATKKMAPEAIAHEMRSVDMYPEDDDNPANEGESPQKIRIDLLSQELNVPKQKRGSLKGATRFFSRGRKSHKLSVRSHSTDCPSSTRTVSDGSESPGSVKSGPNGSKLKKNDSRKKDKMQKSLSYFL